MSVERNRGEAHSKNIIHFPSTNRRYHECCMSIVTSLLACVVVSEQTTCRDPSLQHACGIQINTRKHHQRRYATRNVSHHTLLTTLTWHTSWDGRRLWSVHWQADLASQSALTANARCQQTSQQSSTRTSSGPRLKETCAAAWWVPACTAATPSSKHHLRSTNTDLYYIHTWPNIQYWTRMSEGYVRNAETILAQHLNKDVLTQTWQVDFLLGKIQLFGVRTKKNGRLRQTTSLHAFANKQAVIKFLVKFGSCPNSYLLGGAHSYDFVWWYWTHDVSSREIVTNFTLQQRHLCASTTQYHLHKKMAALYREPLWFLSHFRFEYSSMYSRNNTLSMLSAVRFADVSSCESGWRHSWITQPMIIS